VAEGRRQKAARIAVIADIAGIARNRKSKIAQLHANLGLTLETHANLGCLGLTLRKCTPIWDTSGRGRAAKIG
jgi:hypothetical protein